MVRKGVLLGLVVALALVGLPGVAQDLGQGGLALLQRNRADLARAAAPTLARWIDASRQQAVADGVRPIPPALKTRLVGFFAVEMLDRVRYRVGAAPRGLLPAAAFGYGNAIAITLGDIIVFRNAAQAESDAALWAHELQHVLQFESWGVSGFAEAYLADWEAVETEARAAAAEFKIWDEVRHAQHRLP